MADPLYELLTPYLEAQDGDSTVSPRDPTTSYYLNHLTTLSLTSLTSTELQSLIQSNQSTLRSLQALSKRSHKAIISSNDHIARLKEELPKIQSAGEDIAGILPELESAATKFNKKYDRSSENEVLDRRRKAMLLNSNIDRISSILDLPSLLSTTISSSASAQTQSASATAPTTANYASALDLQAHIKRLHTLYPNSALVGSISAQAEEEMKAMTSNLITSLQSPNLKLAAAMRTVGWLRRVAPELASDAPVTGKPASIAVSPGDGGGGALGALFLTCRLANLRTMLSALDPLKELADAETSARKSPTAKPGPNSWQGSQQTERFLKRYIEIFREQSFAVVSMYKSIFPSALPMPGSDVDAGGKANQDATLAPPPSPLATFTLTLVDMLADTLRNHLSNIQERGARDSLLTQVLYCAGSLGRLGGDFGMILALLEEELREDEDEDEEEWVEMFKKHRVQASRLELLAQGVGVGVSAGRRVSSQAG